RAHDDGRGSADPGDDTRAPRRSAGRLPGPHRPRQHAWRRRQRHRHPALRRACPAVLTGRVSSGGLRLAPLAALGVTYERSLRGGAVSMRYARLTRPLVRKNGALCEASWDEALDRAAEGFRAV